MFRSSQLFVLRARIDCSQAVVAALVRAVESPVGPGARAGQVRLRTRAEAIALGPGGRVLGVRAAGAPGGGRDTAGGGAVASLVRAREGVISNAPIWDTVKLLPAAGEFGGTFLIFKHVEFIVHGVT